MAQSDDNSPNYDVRLLGDSGDGNASENTSGGKNALYTNGSKTEFTEVNPRHFKLAVNPDELKQNSEGKKQIGLQFMISFSPQFCQISDAGGGEIEVKAESNSVEVLITIPENCFSDCPYIDYPIRIKLSESPDNPVEGEEKWLCFTVEFVQKST